MRNIMPVYVNSLLTSLNSRESLRGIGMHEEQSTSINIINGDVLPMHTFVPSFVPVRIPVHCYFSLVDLFHLGSRNPVVSYQ
jgi:hypothetical protein